MRGGRKGFSVVSHRARDVPRRAPRTSALAPCACALLIAGCGGGARQDASEPAGTFAMKVVHASFPSAQSIARQTRFALEVENAGTRTVPDVAVTINSFDYTSTYPGLAADKRPVWAIERGPGTVASPPVESEQVSPPGGGQTAYVNTWALGALAPGKTRTFVWRVVPVKAGSYTVQYTVAAGLSGKAKARLASGAPVQGQFAVDIASAPKLTHVNPATGRVEAGAFPASP
ncbi:MAG: hypothetical protein ABSG93_03095 [Solirubrobacteraceae bacterium]